MANPEGGFAGGGSPLNQITATYSNKYAFYNETIPAGITYTTSCYIGNTNSVYPLQAPNQMCVFVKNASATLTVSLEVAYIPTDVSQSPKPTDADFIAYKTYTQDTVEPIASLNGLWYRFKINNTGVASTITCNLGD